MTASSVDQMVEAAANSEKTAEKLEKEAKDKEERLTGNHRNLQTRSELKTLLKSGQTLFVVLAGASLVLVVVVLADARCAANSEDVFTFLVLELLVGMVVPPLALLIGFYTGIRSERERSPRP